MNALLDMSNIQPNREAKDVEDIWGGNFGQPNYNREERKEASRQPDYHYEERKEASRQPDYINYGR